MAREDEILSVLQDIRRILDERLSPGDRAVVLPRIRPTAGAPAVTIRRGERATVLTVR